jgi:hypothetical protein
MLFAAECREDALGERCSIQWGHLFGANVQGDRTMSSDQRYQSQLFNVILRQSRELAEQWQRNTRQAKVASLWGMQMAIYPVYVLFQVTRISEQVLRQADTQGQRLLQAALDPDRSPLQGHSVDLPLRRVLDAIKISDQPAEENGECLVVSVAALKSRSIPIWQRYQRWFQRLRQAPDHKALLQGLATDLETRHLVLVIPDNEPLDVLTLDQQKHVLQLMTWEVAHYQRQQRLNHQWRTVARRRPLSEPRLRSQMLPSVRGFRHLMGWFQTSPMATATNLFHEAQAVDPLLLLTGEIDRMPIPETLGETLRRLSPQLTPEALQMVDSAIAEWETLSWQVVGPTAADLSAQIAHRFQQQQVRHHLSQPLLSAETTVDAPRPAPVGWLQSALITLFGTTPSTSPASTIAQQRELSLSPSWTDLYREPIQNAPVKTPLVQIQVPTDSTPAVMPVSIPAERITIGEKGVEIEVDAVFVEYEQHALERILNALDRAVSWLEKSFMPWLQQSWSVVKVYVQQLRES